MEMLQNAILKISSLSPQSMTSFLAAWKYWSVPKDHLLVREQTVSDYLYFIQKGAARIYYYKNEKEITEWIALDEQFFLSITSYFQRTPSLKKETVNNATKMSDLIPHYPSDWVSDYVSVELVYIKDGASSTFSGKNETLTAEQKNILKSAVIGGDIAINIKYKTKNAVNGKEEVSTMHYETAITPDIEAQFETKTNAKHDESDGRTATIRKRKHR